MLFEVPEDWQPDDWSLFKKPGDWSVIGEIMDKHDFSILVPGADADIPAKRMRELVRSRSNESGITSSEALLSSGEAWSLDMEALWKLYYEHRRYAYSRGFSDTQMDVLRAIEFHGSERVSIQEIKSSTWIEGGPSESTIYNALTGLIEAGLIERTAPNNYQYIGPTDGK